MPSALDIGSPLWWVAKLDKALRDKRPDLRRYDDYYEGKHPLGFATPKFKEAFGDLFNQFSDNWCDLVADAVEERLRVQGVRIPQTSTTENVKDSASGDQEAWRFWQANNLDADSGIAHLEALVHGASYAIVWYRDGDDTTPDITIEHPMQMVVAHAAGNRRLRRAALKRWIDDDGYDRATLYLPDEIHRFRSKQKSDSQLIMPNSLTDSRWTPFTGDGETVIPNPLGVVPVVPIVNRRRLLNEGVSEIAKVIPIQDGVNKLVADMLVASEFGAAPQRWATGIEIPKDPQTGKTLPMFENLVSRLWASERKDATFGQFGQTDLKPFVEGIEMLVQHIASQTRTPPHYFYLRGQFPSGESIKSAETGLVAKGRRKMLSFGEAWEEVFRLGFRVVGNEAKANVMNAEILWGDPESRSESEHVDAVMKRKSLGVPEEALWEELGATPQQIERWKQLRAEAVRAPEAASVDELSFDERVQALTRYVQAGFDPEEASKILGLPTVKHTGRLPVTVQPDSKTAPGNLPALPPVPVGQ